MTAPGPAMVAQRAWGIAAVTVAVLSIIPTVYVATLAGTADPGYGWFLFLSIPILVVGEVIALLVGLVGVVFAAVRRRGFGWPVAGAALGLAALVVLGVALALAEAGAAALVE